MTAEILASNIQGQMAGFISLMDSMAYIAAIGMLIAAAIGLKKHGENPEKTPLSQVLIRFVVGLMLLPLPSMITVMIPSIIVPSASLQADKADQAKKESQKIQELVQKQELTAKAESAALVSVAETTKQIEPDLIDLDAGKGKFIKGAKPGRSSDFSALLEVLAAFSAFALLAWYFIKKADNKNKHGQSVELALKKIDQLFQSKDAAT